MFKPPEFREGDQAGVVGTDGVLRMGGRLAEALQTAALELVRLGKFSAAAPFSLEEGTDGRRLAVNLPEEFWAKLSGTGNPYSFVEQQFVAGSGFSDLAAGRSGSNAYESTGRAGLAGKVVRLAYEEVSNDWRFQWVGFSSTCVGGTTRICVTVTDGCGSPAAVPGATVTVKQGTTTIGTCTTDAAGQCCVAVTQSGSYTVVATKGGKTTPTTTLTAICNIDNAASLAFVAGDMTRVTFNVTDPCVGPLLGATIDLSQGGVSVGSGVTNVAGTSAAQCTIYGIPNGVSTLVTYSAPRHTTATRTTSFAGGCSGTSDSPISLALATGYACACGPPCVVPTTLTLTDDYYGTCTITYNSLTGFWEGSSTVAYGGCGSCPAGSMTIKYQFGFNAGGGGTGCAVGISTPYSSLGAPWFNTCPGGTDGVGSGYFDESGSGSCGPFVATFGPTGFGGAPHSAFPWCYPNGIYITVTE